MEDRTKSLEDLISCQGWRSICWLYRFGHRSVDFTDLRIISKRTMEELEKKAVISKEEVNLTQRSAVSLNFSWWICQSKQKKWRIVRSELKIRRKHESASRNSSLQTTQGTAAMSCQGTSRPFSVQAVHCTFMLNNTNEWSVVSLNKHHLHIS